MLSGEPAIVWKATGMLRPEMLRVGTKLIRKSDSKLFWIIDIKKTREFGREVTHYALASPTALGLGGEIKIDLSGIQANFVLS